MRMKKSVCMSLRYPVAVLTLLLSACSFHPSPPSKPAAAMGSPVPARAHAAVTPADFGVLKWREIGPAVMGGRLDAVAGIPGDSTTIYLGHSSGGLYKSTNGGMTFSSIFRSGTSSSIGAIGIAPSDPKTVYIGTGEGFPRNTAAIGDGVFVSRDGGSTWRTAGLTKTQHVARIAVDPQNPQIALVAVMGPEFNAGGDRGIYRTDDGGVHWTRVLYVNPTTGGSDVAFDPSNGAVAYAGTFDYLRQPWTFRGGGAGSGLYKSVDGGKTWRLLTDSALHNGLPGGIINRVGVALSAHHPNVVYAVVPTKSGILYRSNDAGNTWKLVNASQDLVFRPFYFSQVRVDPNDPNDVWIVSGELRRSKDGGKHFKSVDAGGDNHDLWIDPQNASVVLLGSDMGFHRSVDAGKTWNYVNTVPFAQVYRVGYDREVPYHVMGGMQDHEVWWGPSNLWNGTGIDGGSWRNISDWGDGQYAQPDPANANIIYEDTHFGDLTRRDLTTGEARYIGPQPVIAFGTGAGAQPYRFNWSAPLLVSSHVPHPIYYGANVLFESDDEGTSWRAISPDLSQPCKKEWIAESGGPITHDNTNAEAYCTIYALAEDVSDGALWAGTDDGNLEITKDGGATWTNVTANVPGLPPNSWVASIDASRVSSGSAYVTFDRHRFGDTKPYVYRTTDFGAHWMNVGTGLPYWAYVVREDPRQPNLLFAGTEEGVFASFDRGAHWASLDLGSGHVPVYDLQIQPDANDLIAGTHGRGFAILDDITPLETLAGAVHGDVALFTPRDAWRYAARPTHDFGENEFIADVKPYGADISYYLSPRPHPKSEKKKAPREKITLQILDTRGTVVRDFTGTAKDGINRVAWDLTTNAPGGTHAVQDPRPYYVFYPLEIDGPEVLPGTYTVRLHARGETLNVPLTVRLDPTVKVSNQDLQAQYDALSRLASMQEQGERWLADIRRSEKKKHSAALDRFADRLRNGDGSENAGYKHPAQVLDQIAYLRHIIASSFAAPTQVQMQLIERYGTQVKALEPDAQRLLKGRTLVTQR